MPWTASKMDQRKHAITLIDEGVSKSEAARLTGVSRQCLHKWIGRYNEFGDDGLADRSRAPKKHPMAVSEQMRKQIVQMKKRFPDEGPKKIRVYLLKKYQTERIPAPSTIGLVLKEKGLVVPKARKRRPDVVTKTTLTEATEPNHVWAMDYKGEFQVGQQLCYPLTVTDTFARYALAINAHHGANTAQACRSLWRTFGQYGLPNIIRSDNGTPFVSTKSPAGLTKLSVMLARLGIERERIQPGKPAQNGRHERFHRSMKGATANPPACSWNAQQKRFERYRKHYNEYRPHESLANKTPASVFSFSSRTRPDTLPPIEHPLAQRIVKVYSSGEITLCGHKLFLTSTLANETVAINEVADDIFRVSYGPLYLGTFFLNGKISFERSP
jgi:transposase InsO family protein